MQASTGPLAIWQFEEASWRGTANEVVDSSGNGLHGVAQQGANTGNLLPAIPGSTGTCRYASIRAGDYVTLQGADVLKNIADAITVAGWIKITHHSPYNYLFSTARDCCGSYKGVELRVSQNKARFSIWDENGRRKNLDSATTLNLNQWYHIAGVLDGASMQVYVDGVLSGSRAVSGKIGTPASFDPVIGALAAYPSAYNLQGFLDEVAVYDRALSGTEIVELKDKTHACAAETPQLQGAWFFDETQWASGQQEVSDNSRHARHGSAHGSAHPVQGLVCNAVDLSENGVTDYIRLDPAVLDGTEDVTVSVWAKTGAISQQASILSAAVPRQYNQFLWYWPSARVFQPFVKGTSSKISTTSIDDSAWKHLVWRRRGGENCLFINAEKQGCANLPSEAISMVDGGLIIGQEQDSVEGGFVSNQDWDGRLDELLLFDQGLDDSDIRAIYLDQSQGLNWDGQPRVCQPTCPVYSDQALLFEDNFDDNDYAGWDVKRFNDKGCNWSVNNGVLSERRNACHGFLGNDLSHQNRYLQSYTLQVDIDANITGGNNGVGLIFGYVDHDNYYMVRWKNYGTAYSGSEGDWSRASRDFELLKVTRGARTILDRRQNIALPETFTLSVVVDEADGITAWVDCDTQQYALQASGERPAIQTFGLYTYDNDSGIAYDNVKVYGDYLSLPDPVAQWHFEETGWNGTANEVLDSSGNQLHGTAQNGASTEAALPAIPGTVGTCRYAKIEEHSLRPDEHIKLNNAPQINEIEDAVTVAGWIKVTESSAYDYLFSNTRDCCGPYRGFEIGIRRGRVLFSLWDADGNINRLHSTTPITVDQWYHIAGVFDGAEMKIYVDGALSGSRSFTGKMGVPASFDPIIGAMGHRPDIYNLKGFLDEVVIYDEALSSSQINVLKEQVRYCEAPTLERFTLSHDGAGIYCSAGETVLLEARNNYGDVHSTYTGTVTLDTQTGSGSWVATTGAGFLRDAIPGDGMATYTFVAADQGQVAFTLQYPDGPKTFNIDAYDGAVRDDDSEDDFVFSASGFLLTANPVTDPPASDPVSTQLAGQNFPIYITAYGTTSTDPVCGVIESYTGDRSLRLWGEYLDPVSGSFSMTIDGQVISMGTYQRAQTVRFDQGKASVNVKYRDAGKIRLRVYDLNEADVITGNSNGFVVKPVAFELTHVLRQPDSMVNPEASDATGPAFTAAGKPFEVTVTAVDRDGNLTPNYGQEKNPESIVLSHQLVQPSGGQAGTLSGSLVNQHAGTFTGTFSWSEVGILSLTANVADGSYLGAGDISAVLPRVGRFTPAQFALSGIDGGAFADACSAGFTYIGQTFGYQTPPSLSITAQNAFGDTTQNYEGAFAFLTKAGVSVAPVTADHTQLGTGSLPLAITQTVDSSGRVITPSSAGTFEFTFGDDRYEFDKTDQALVDPFNADIQLRVTSVSDGDVSSHFTSGNTLEPVSTQLVYGRAFAKSAHGSELQDLSLPVILQRYDAAIGDFIRHSADSCTPVPAEMLTHLDGSLDAAALNGAFSSVAPGEFRLTLFAPGAGQTGSVQVDYTVPTYLQYPWKGSVDQNPSAVATFGIYQESPVIIFRRDVR